MLLLLGVVILILILVFFILLVKLFTDGDSSEPSPFEAPERRAGKKGEKRATNIIRSVLKEDDRLFTNVQISYKNRPAELDNVIVNKYGVFIIEVKNYNGWLVGKADDYEWIKYHTTQAGNTYSKTVKNPIKQVKRQVYLLAKYLELHAPKRVWVDGYAILLEKNSPVESAYVLTSVQDIDKAIHTSKRNRLTQNEIDEILNVLL